MKKSLNFIRVTLVSGTQRRRRGEPTRREGEAGWPRLPATRNGVGWNAKVVPDSDPFATFGDDARHALSYRPVRNAQLSKKDFDGALLCVGQERRLRRFAGSRSGVHKGDKPVASSRCPTNALQLFHVKHMDFLLGAIKKRNVSKHVNAVQRCHHTGPLSNGIPYSCCAPLPRTIDGVTRGERKARIGCT